MVTRVSNPVRRSISSCDHVADAAEAHVAELVLLAALQRERALPRHRALGDHDDREVGTVAVTVLDARAHLVDVERHLGHEHDVGAAGHARVDGDPPRVAAHHLHHHHPVVALGGGVQPVDGVGGDLHRGLEPEGEVGGARGRCRSSWARPPPRRRPRRRGERRRRACPRRRSRPGRRCARARGCRGRAPRRRRTGTGWCAKCRGWCRRGG